MKQTVVAFQGLRGAYSEQACRERLPGWEVLPCRSFDDIFQAVEAGQVEAGMIPVENSVAGVVADSYDLLARHHLQIVGEHYLAVRHCLLALPGTRLEEVHTVSSHPQALAQCRNFLRRQGVTTQAFYDTAGAAAALVEKGVHGEAAIAAEICAELYGLAILARGIQDSRFNTTRFLVVARQGVRPPLDLPCKTSLLFEVRDIPAALYKSLGGFATNGVNLTRLESRPVPGKNWAYQFHLDFQGHPEEERCRLALEELSFFTTTLKILGSYQAAARPMETEGEP